MIGTCIKVANEAEHQPVWSGKDPVDFTTDMTRLTTGHSEILKIAALWEQASGGVADMKESHETALENNAYLLARACYNHFKKIGDFTRAGKTDYTKSSIVLLRDQELITTTSAIRDLADHAVTTPGAADRGITPQRIAELTKAISDYEKIVNSPRSQTVNRNTLGREIIVKTAALYELVQDMDDLVLQFATTEAGERFTAAWKRARVIVDAGSGHGPSPTPDTPT